MKEAPRMKNGTLMVSLALHGVIAIGAFIYAAHSPAPEAPAENVVWIDMAPPPEKAPPRPLDPPKVDPPKVDSPAPRPAAPRPASPAPARAPMAAAIAGNRPGTGQSGGGLGVLAGDGPGDGFEMNPEPGDGTGNGNAGAPAPPPPPPPPPPKIAPPKPKECDEPATKPKPVAKPRSIEYSDAARADGKEGRLLLQLTVGEDGSVSRVDVLSGVHPALDAAAIAAVKTWRFEPATRCGKPVSGATYKVARKFELGD